MPYLGANSIVEKMIAMWVISLKCSNILFSRWLNLMIENLIAYFSLIWLEIYQNCSYTSNVDVQKKRIVQML